MGFNDGYIDNGDGTITVNGFKIAKPFGMKMPNAPAGPAPAPPMAPIPGLSSPEKSTLEVPGLALPGGPAYQPKPPGPQPLPPTDPQTAAIVNQLQRSGQAPMTVQPSPDQAGGAQSPMARPQGMAPQGGGFAMPQASGPRVIDPGGMKTVAETTQKGTPIAPELRQQREDAMLSARAAGQAGYEASAVEGEQTGDAARQYADETQRRLEEEQQRAELHRQTLADAQSKLERMQTDYRSKAINEDTYWQENGAGAKLAAGIWVTLGQLGQQMTHTGENTAKSVIDKQVDSWVGDQKERRGIALQGQQSLVGNIRENFASESAQDAALRAQAYDAYRAKLGAIVGENAPEKLKADALKLDAELQQKSADWGIQAGQLEADHVTTQARLVAPTVAGGTQKALDRSLVVQDVNGDKFLARDVDQARDLNKKLALTKQADAAAKKMAEIADKSAGEKIDPNSPLGKEFGFAREQFTNSMNGLQEQGVVRGDDIKRYEEYTGGAYGLSTAQAARKLASKATTAYQYHLDSKADTESPVDEEFGTNAAGQADKYAHYRTTVQSSNGPIPIAVPGGGRKKKKGVSFTPFGEP